MMLSYACSLFCLMAWCFGILLLQPAWVQNRCRCPYIVHNPNPKPARIKDLGCSFSSEEKEQETRFLVSWEVFAKQSETFLPPSCTVLDCEILSHDHCGKRLSIYRLGDLGARCFYCHSQWLLFITVPRGVFTITSSCSYACMPE